MPWHDDDHFWQTIARVIFTPERDAAAPAEVEKALALLAAEPAGPLPAGAALLDLPCGQGRHSLEFARRGFHVTGADRTEPYLTTARARLADLLQSPTPPTGTCSFLHADMLNFDGAARFDAVFNLYTSFGYFDDPADDARALVTFLRALKPGGRLLMDMLGKEPLARDFMPRGWRTLPDGTLVLDEAEVVGHFERVKNTTTLVFPTGERRTHAFTVRPYSAVELVALARGAGFADVRCYGGLDGTPYNHKAKRLILTARRPGATELLP